MKNIIIPLLTISLLIILFAGIIPSIILCDWIWFSRSGSLLTTYGITLTFLDFTGFMKKVVEPDLERRINEGFRNNELPSMTREELEPYRKEILKRIVSQYRTVEFLSLFIGTIIWGYGDLFA